MRCRRCGFPTVHAVDAGMWYWVCLGCGIYYELLGRHPR